MRHSSRLTVADPEVRERVRRTVELLDRRGYALPVARVAELLVGGARGEDEVRAAARDAGLVVTRDLVHVAGREGVVAASERRLAAHADAAARWAPVALAYARAVRRHCPWVQSVLVSGSLASGGFVEDDDLDVSLVVEDGTKYVSYLACLALALPVAWRHRRKPHGPEASLPLLAKVVCINVVWEDAQTRPFVRGDEAMALEILLSRPIAGAAAWRDVLDANPALHRHFPQLGAVDPAADVDAPPSALSRALAAAARGPPRRRALDAAAHQAARALHALVRWSRRRRPEIAAHVARVEATKRPYAILDRPEDAR